MVTQTTMDSWIKLQSEGKVSANQMIILDVFRRVNHQPLSARDVKEMLNWSDMNMVRPRINELVKMRHLVHICNKLQLQTSRTVQVYCLAEDVLYHNPGWTGCITDTNAATNLADDDASSTRIYYNGGK